MIEILTRKAAASYLQHLREKKVSYIFAGNSEINLPTALRKLRKLFKRLLLEGGGKISGSFPKAGGTPILFDVEKGYGKRKAA